MRSFHPSEKLRPHKRFLKIVRNALPKRKVRRHEGIRPFEDRFGGTLDRNESGGIPPRRLKASVPVDGERVVAADAREGEIRPLRTRLAHERVGSRAALVLGTEHGPPVPEGEDQLLVAPARPPHGKDRQGVRDDVMAGIAVIRPRLHGDVDAVMGEVRVRLRGTSGEAPAAEPAQPLAQRNGKR